MDDKPNAMQQFDAGQCPTTTSVGGVVAVATLAAAILLVGALTSCAGGRKDENRAPTSEAAAATAKAEVAPPSVDGAATAPLLSGIGDHHFPVTTTDPVVQRYVNQGLVLAYGFNHAEAGRAFREAARRDPSCAMAWWGAALVLGPHVNAPMNADDYPKAWDAIQRAKAVMGGATRRERDYILALERRYQPEALADRKPLDLAYADAMREVVRRHPDDTDAATLLAEAIMDTMPWDYWSPEGQARRDTPELLAVLESVIARDPRNPGAHHLYIHAVEAGPFPEKGLPSADALAGGLTPSLGHLVHMPGHIYLRLGMYERASAANIAAIAADERYLGECKRQGMYPLAYYPHNMHFLWYSRTMEGRAAEAMAAAVQTSTYSDANCGLEATGQRPLPLLAKVRFGRWDEILAEPVPQTADATFHPALWHYARGVAQARTGRADDADRSLARLRALADSDAARALDGPSFPATRVLVIATHELSAEVARSRGDADEAISQYGKAVDVQDALPYMEPPYWHYPVRHALGAYLLETGRSADAEAVYTEDLRRNPNNGYALLGLAQAYEAQGRTHEAGDARARQRTAFANADVTLTSSRF